MMTRIMMATCGLVMFAGAVFGQARDAIEDVIGNQLRAFNDRDMTEAFSYASPMIQGMFRDPARFGFMVENGYPMVWNNADVRFLDLREEAGMQIQRVIVKDEQGNIHTLDYAMIATADGWLINGVALVDPDLAA